MDEIERECRKIEEEFDVRIKRINEQTKRIREIDEKIKWNKIQLEGMKEYYDSKKSGEYVGD